MKQLYEACYGNKRKSESAFFFADNEDQAWNFATIIEDEIGRKLMWFELSSIKRKPTHDYKALKAREKRIMEKVDGL